ncbi:MAG: hypothetical protein QM578_08490 [Pantoea sp.]|uniref:Transposase n=1 Tax=Pantoea phytobeneficialis TaxID=2052056 RepID=A0ABT8Y0X9_9GAMM|nr:Rpn family recombination-promoting nuclease/putative transposase [Pantoea phytobeneficialis]MDO6409394.1 hypothetical protein [Pantoea phytobeneficialis]
MTIEQQWRQESYLQGFKEGFMEGFLEGFQERLQEGKLQVAQRMLRENVDIKTIMKFTGLSEKDLQQINA